MEEKKTKERHPTFAWTRWLEWQSVCVCVWGDGWSDCGVAIASVCSSFLSYDFWFIHSLIPLVCFSAADFVDCIKLFVREMCKQSEIQEIVSIHHCRRVHGSRVRSVTSHKICKLHFCTTFSCGQHLGEISGTATIMTSHKNTLVETDNGKKTKIVLFESKSEIPLGSWIVIWYSS